MTSCSTAATTTTPLAPGRATPASCSAPATTPGGPTRSRRTPGVTRSRSPMPAGTRSTHDFYDDGSGVLAVDLSILDAGGAVVHTWTLSDPSDVIGVTVGGNRYGWFAHERVLVPGVRQLAALGRGRSPDQRRSVQERRLGAVQHAPDVQEPGRLRQLRPERQVGSRFSRIGREGPPRGGPSRLSLASASGLAAHGACSRAQRELAGRLAQTLEELSAQLLALPQIELR